ncbi:competence protein ComK [Fredinandcohnia humi]
MYVKNISYLMEYEINSYTMAIIPIKVGNNLCSRVLEAEGECVVLMKPIDIVDRSCRFFGSSLKGRQEGTREIMGVTHKAPIIIEASNQIFFFPTSSPSKPQCAWLSHTYILDCTYEEHDWTNIIFTNKKSIQLQISQGSFKNQLHRTAQLRTIVSSRMEKKEKRFQFVLSPQEQQIAEEGHILEITKKETTR